MINDSSLRSLAGRTMHGPDHEKIGKIVDVYESTEGADGTFVTVATGLFGSHASFVPLAEAELRGDDVVVPYHKDLVKDAPRVDNDEELTSQEEDRLYAHYRLSDGAAAGAVAAPAVGHRDAEHAEHAEHAGHETVGHDTSGPTTDDAMTRSEERLQVGTLRTEAGRARLRKRIVTENETVTVPVSHEEVRVQREPITEANAGAAYDGPALSEEEHEVVLRAEKPVVSKETVAVERVRLGTGTVTDDVTVNEQVRKEQIDTDGVDGTRR